MATFEARHRVQGARRAPAHLKAERIAGNQARWLHLWRRAQGAPHGHRPVRGDKDLKAVLARVPAARDEARHAGNIGLEAVAKVKLAQRAAGTDQPLQHRRRLPAP